MHPQKAKLLAQLEELSRLKDETLKEGLAVACAPGRYGWVGSLVTATVMLPLTGLGAVFTDVSIILAAHSADATWEKAFPTAGEE